MSFHTSPNHPTVEELERLCTHDRKPFFDIALAYCTPESSVLDIGAGEGDFARMVSCGVTLVDANPNTVEKLRGEFENVLLHRVPDPLPCADGSFDVVHCSHLVEHLLPEAFYALLGEVDRVLRPGGVFVVSAPLLWSGFYDDLSHVRPYTPAVFKKYLGASASNPTRDSIARGYIAEELVYRYNKTPPGYFDVSTSQRWAKRLLLRIVNRLRRHRFRRYEVTGFTLVMRKPSERSE